MTDYQALGINPANLGWHLEFEEKKAMKECKKLQESFKLKPFREANSWAIIPEGLEVINEDQKIEIVPLNIGESINI